MKGCVESRERDSAQSLITDRMTGYSFRLVSFQPMYFRPVSFPAHAGSPEMFIKVEEDGLYDFGVEADDTGSISRCV